MFNSTQVELTLYSLSTRLANLVDLSCRGAYQLLRERHPLIRSCAHIYLAQVAWFHVDNNKVKTQDGEYTRAATPGLDLKAL
jgi:hypothetical protein